MVVQKYSGIKQQENTELSNYVFGKVQPQALPLEEAVLGAIMLDKDAIIQVIDILAASSFYSDAHGMIYNAMLRLFEKLQPIDILTVTEELKKSGELEQIGGAYCLVELTNKVGSSANIEYHSRIISEKAIQRGLISVSTKTISSAYDESNDVFDILSETEQGLFELTKSSLTRSAERYGKISIEALKELEIKSQIKEGITGVPSGLKDLDKLTNGWQNSDLIIVAGRPGSGKTSFALTGALNAALDYKKPVAMFSLEMGRKQLVNRIQSIHSGVNGNKFVSAKFSEEDWHSLHSTVETLSDIPIFIDDTPGITSFELRAKSRRLKSRFDIELIIIDYLQLMLGEKGKGNREQEISAISRQLKTLAKELDIPVIALSQLSRAVESRGGAKRPLLSDLRESGSIEQDADLVAFIYRPEYYNIESDEEGNSTKGLAEVIVSKHRNGATDTVKTKFIDYCTKFEDLEDPDFYSNTFPVSASNGTAINLPTRINDEDVPV